MTAIALKELINNALKKRKTMQHRASVLPSCSSFFPLRFKKRYGWTKDKSPFFW